MVTITDIAREKFEQERRRQGLPNLGIQVGFVYGCGGAGFRVIFSEDPQGSHLVDVDGIRIALDAESRQRLEGMVIDWAAGLDPGFVILHPDAVLVEFC